MTYFSSISESEGTHEVDEFQDVSEEPQEETSVNMDRIQDDISQTAEENTESETVTDNTDEISQSDTVIENETDTCALTTSHDASYTESCDKPEEKSVDIIQEDTEAVEEEVEVVEDIIEKETAEDKVENEAALSEEPIEEQEPEVENEEEDEEEEEERVDFVKGKYPYVI